MINPYCPVSQHSLINSVIDTLFAKSRASHGVPGVVVKPNRDELWDLCK